MLSAGSPERPAKTSGRLSQALIKLMMRQASIVAAERLADRFKLITLEGEALNNVDWIPGQKIQISMGSAFVARTYTPIAWNGSAGRTCILAFEPGLGPGSEWVRDVEPGDRCNLFGPRTSLDLRGVNGPVALFGDETSIGLAYALSHAQPGRKMSCAFEVEDASAAWQVLQKLDLAKAELVAKQPDDRHLEALEAKLPQLLAARTTFVLTGKASTVQRIRQNLKRYADLKTTIITKAYWAPGKTGLD